MHTQPIKMRSTNFLEEGLWKKLATVKYRTLLCITIQSFICVAMAVVLIIFIIDIFIVSLLIHGARKVCYSTYNTTNHFFLRKGQPGFLTPWIVLTAISLVLQVLSIILTLITQAWASSFAGFVGLIIHGYLLVCVWSLR